MTTEEAQFLLNDPDVQPEAKEAVRWTMGQKLSERRDGSGNSKPSTPVSSGGVRALAAARTPGQMTKTERLYSLRLDADPAVVGWDYESDRLKLADAVTGGKAKWYRVDFTVQHAEGRVSWDEVKGGYITDAGMERFRALCQRFPRRWFRMWQYERGRWTLKLESGATYRKEAA